MNITRHILPLYLWGLRFSSPRSANLYDIILSKENRYRLISLRAHSNHGREHYTVAQKHAREGAFLFHVQQSPSTLFLRKATVTMS